MINKAAILCSRLYTLHQIPMSIVDREGHFLHSWPKSILGTIRQEMTRLLIEEFSQLHCDRTHPVVHFFDKGFFVALNEISEDLYLIIGLCSPYPHTREELMEMCAQTVVPEHMQLFCDLMLQVPVVNRPQICAFSALAAQLFSGQEIPEENILYQDIALHALSRREDFDKARFLQREEADEHTTLDYENGVCLAIESGRSDLLIKALYSPRSGQVGTMSVNALRQLRYSYISFTTLVSRAAVRGGLPMETAFLLSDLYCQRMDVLTERGDIERLLVDMAMDFCDKVAKNRKMKLLSSVTRQALDYISVHLHESFSMEELADHCGLCRRSLSLHFKQQMGMGIVEYIHRERIREAQFLLEQTELSLSQISACLNYSSQSYFTQLFRKYIGQTPEKYRTGHKQIAARHKLM